MLVQSTATETVADPEFAKGGVQTMASVEHEPIIGVQGWSPHRRPWVPGGG